MRSTRSRWRVFLIFFARCVLTLRSPIFAGDSTATVDSSKFFAKVAPALEIMGLNLSIAATNRFVRDVEYAQIDEETIAHNLAHGWVWDDNSFEVNQLGHPIQGGLYYSIARGEYKSFPDVRIRNQELRVLATLTL